MNLQNSLASGDLVHQPTSKNEIQELLRLASRWQSDASVAGLSTEGKFNSAYEAVLQLATVPLRCSGYRARSQAHHYVIFDVLPDIMGDQVKELARYFQACRNKRNLLVYRKASAVSIAEVEELIAEAEDFSQKVHHWIKEHYPEYA